MQQRQPIIYNIDWINTSHRFERRKNTLNSENEHQILIPLVPKNPRCPKKFSSF